MPTKTKKAEGVWKLLGKFGVDSGQVLIVDPCYLDGWDTSVDLPPRELYEHVVTGTRYRCNIGLSEAQIKADKAKGIVHFFTYDTDINGSTPNELRKSKAWKMVPCADPRSGDFSYYGCCAATNTKPLWAGELNYHATTAVAAATGWGDGCYPVYGYFSTVKDRISTGRIMQIAIIFDTEYITDPDLRKQLKADGLF